jgi:hypothetical protein
MRLQGRVTMRRQSARHAPSSAQLIVSRLPVHSPWATATSQAGDQSSCSAFFLEKHRPCQNATTVGATWAKTPTFARPVHGETVACVGHRRDAPLVSNRVLQVFFFWFFHVARPLPGTSGATMRRRSARHGRPRLPLRRTWRGGCKHRGSLRCTARAQTRASGLFSMWRADCCPAQVAPQGGKGRHDTGDHAWAGGVHGEAAASTGGRCDAPRMSKRGRRVRGQCGASVWSRHAWRHRATRVGVTCETTPGSVLFMASWPRQPGVAQTCRACANACGGAPQYFRRKTYIFVAYIYCLTFLYIYSPCARNNSARLFKLVTTSGCRRGPNHASRIANARSYKGRADA